MAKHKGRSRSALPLLCILMAAFSRFPAARAAILPEAPGIRVIPPSEVLRDHSVTDADGVLFFEDAAGARVRLITSAQDPEIRNPGDGAFHPAEESIVLAALQQVPAGFLMPLRIDVYLLPYPRSGQLSSSADGSAIYITPGVVPYDARQIHFLIAHEIGHAVHRALMPDTDRRAWSAWALLRGVADTTVYNDRAPHANRPHEIFAEDFRVLFGGDLARGDGTIENAGIPRPDLVPGLGVFYADLEREGSSPAALTGTAAAAAPAWRIGPNPLPAGTEITLWAPSWGAPAGTVEAGLFDVSGRRVALLRFRPAGDGVWRLAADRPGELAAGAYWVRIAGAGPDFSSDPLGGVPVTMPLRVIP